jgi:KaiC/GvpD/RAD55 family RecA-like ATPase
MFQQASASDKAERAQREKGIQTLKFGVDFLDDALRGIFPDDLILLGAPSGVGKTQLCCNIALANIADGRNVHYIALEAGEYEIERRLKWPLVLGYFLSDKARPNLGKRIDYVDWLMGTFAKELTPYEDLASKYFESAYKNLHLYYKTDKFGLSELITSVHYCAEQTDLIMIDHVHYFDFDDDNENRAIKDIAKTVRSLALEEQRPIILVAHLRKRDRANDDLVAGLEEFHGSSDLFKIATRVITVSPGRTTQEGSYETFFRVPKNRLDGGVTRFSAKEYFDPRQGGYEKNRYQIGWAEQKRSKGFEELDRNLYPAWAGRAGHLPNRQSGDPYPGVKRPPNLAPVARGKND